LATAKGSDFAQAACPLLFVRTLSTTTEFVGEFSTLDTPVNFGSFRVMSAGSPNLNEIAELLAAGLTRVLARKSSDVCAETGESSLHLPPDQSGHPTPDNRRMSDG